MVTNFLVHTYSLVEYNRPICIADPLKALFFTWDIGRGKVKGIRNTQICFRHALGMVRGNSDSERSSCPADKIGDGFGQQKSAKGPQKAQQDQGDYGAREKHSNSGSNTHNGTGVDYVDRKNTHGGNDVQRRREDGNQPIGNHGSVS